MELKATHMQLAPLLVIALARVAATAADLALRGCKNTCGDVSIPYPFGIGVSTATGKKCFSEEPLELPCKNSSLYHGNGNVQILNMKLLGQMDMLFWVSKVCKDGSSSGQTEWSDIFNRVFNKMRQNISDTKTMQSDGNCTGIGCCQVDIPPGMKNISIKAYSFSNFSDSWRFNNCSYSFVAKKGSYNFSLNDLKHLPFEKSTFVVDWTVGSETCNVSKSKPNCACRKNGDSEVSDTGYGYRCKCKTGYEGNSYLPDGCRDIEECKNGAHNCISEHNCLETEGSFECFCPSDQFGDGKREGRGCQQNQRENILTKVAIGVNAGFLTLFVGTSWLYLIYQKRKLIKLNEKFFRQNGSIILQQQLSAREDSYQSAQIFTANQLKRATNNYDESLIIGRGGYGTVFKGFLPNNKVVAIKKFKIMDQSQIKQFINGVVVPSEINHRNVVKLLGCCLETEVPLLVYEFVNNGTLFDYLHNEGKTTNVYWKIHLRIAAEAVGALSNLDLVASIPVIHRDVKSANILLDDKYTAKVFNFGASRLVPLDEIELATMVQGTLGYLDPKYMQTSQLTKKSDVYSFGVVLVELLTREKAISFKRLEGKRRIAMHFLSFLKEDCLFEVLEIGILNEENKEKIKEVVILATRC